MGASRPWWASNARPKDNARYRQGRESDRQYGQPTRCIGAVGDLRIQAYKVDETLCIKMLEVAAVELEGIHTEACG